jgi:hypothetical protein
VYNLRYFNKTLQITLGIKDPNTEIEIYHEPGCWARDNRLESFIELACRDPFDFQNPRGILISGILRFVKFLVLLSEELKSLLGSYEITLVNHSHEFLSQFDRFWNFDKHDKEYHDRQKVYHNPETLDNNTSEYGFFDRGCYDPKIATIRMTTVNHTFGISLVKLNENLVELLHSLVQRDNTPKIWLTLANVDAKDQRLTPKTYSSADPIKFKEYIDGIYQANLISG